jgi:hypothetical protein
VFAAVFGAAGMAFGFNALPAYLEQRLPLHSQELGALALLSVVGVPFVLVAALSWRGDPRWGPVAWAAGLVLIGWIAIELAFMRELNFLHPLCAAVGLGFVWVGNKAAPLKARIEGP